MSDDRQYSYSDPAKSDLIPVLKTIFLYCNASITTEQTVAKRSFIYFVGVRLFPSIQSNSPSFLLTNLTGALRH